MRELLLSQGYTAIVDDEDYDGLAKSKWYALRSGENVYGWRDYRNGQEPFLHRVILNAPKGIEVDHEDGNGLNNQRSNLRLATHGQNTRNRKLSVLNTSGYRGVHWASTKGRWVAQIRVNKTMYHLGYFDDLREAARAYDEAALKADPKFTRFNFSA